ncbi:MAG TPA: DUF4824 family protein [Burkholderiales bacterium]|nr:DUF4824 family protein [Burkholderiales bacterium]
MTLNWSRGHTVAAGIALIALTNAIALGGVAWNRSGEPESVLKLTQREFLRSHGYRLDREGGGLQLSVSWRVLSADSDAAFYWNFQGAPEWLDEAKLAALGFDLSPPPAERRAAWRYERQLPREALVVLELAGPAYQKALERARARAAKEAAKGAETGKTGPGSPAQQAVQFLKNEETANSRLFAVDAGLDAQALRAKYPDRARYTIVRGKVRLSYQYGRGQEARWRGYIADIQNAQLNVPLEFRKAIESAPRTRAPAAVADAQPAFEVTVAFGKRFEPWIMAAGGGR